MAGQVFRGKVPNNSRSLFQLAKQKPLFNLTKRVQRRLLRQLPWQQWRRRRLRRGLAKGRRERERTRAKISLGVLQCPVFCITLYLGDAVRFKSMISRTTVVWFFGHRSLIPHLTMVLFYRMTKLGKIWHYRRKKAHGVCVGIAPGWKGVDFGVLNRRRVAKIASLL